VDLPDEHIREREAEKLAEVRTVLSELMTPEGFRLTEDEPDPPAYVREKWRVVLCKRPIPPSPA